MDNKSLFCEDKECTYCTGKKPEFVRMQTLIKNLKEPLVNLPSVIYL